MGAQAGSGGLKRQIDELKKELGDAKRSRDAFAAKENELRAQNAHLRGLLTGASLGHLLTGMDPIRTDGQSAAASMGSPQLAQPVSRTVSGVTSATVHAGSTRHGSLRRAVALHFPPPPPSSSV